MIRWRDLPWPGGMPAQAPTTSSSEGGGAVRLGLIDSVCAGVNPPDIPDMSPQKLQAQGDKQTELINFEAARRQDIHRSFGKDSGWSDLNRPTSRPSDPTRVGHTKFFPVSFFDRTPRVIPNVEGGFS